MVVIDGVVKAADAVDDEDGNSDVADGDTSEKAATNPPSLGDNDSSAASKNISPYLLMVVLVDVTSSNNNLVTLPLCTERGK